jgi:hypothetical protein
MLTYNVQLVSPEGAVLTEYEVRATSAERAAREVAQDDELERGSGQRRPEKVLRAKVYSVAGGTRTLIRFYGTPKRESDATSSEQPRNSELKDESALPGHAEV